MLVIRHTYNVITIENKGMWKMIYQADINNKKVKKHFKANLR